jgi:hypothetical protein
MLHPLHAPSQFKPPEQGISPSPLHNNSLINSWPKVDYYFHFSPQLDLRSRMSGVMRAAVRSSNKFISSASASAWMDINFYMDIHVPAQSSAPEPSLALSSSSSILDIIYDWVKIYSPAPHNYLIK